MTVPPLRKIAITFTSIFILFAATMYGDELITMLITPLPQDLQSCITNKVSNDASAQSACTVSGGSTTLGPLAVWSTTGRLRDSRMTEDYTRGLLTLTGNEGIRFENTASKFGFLSSANNLHIYQNAYYDGTWKLIDGSVASGKAGGFQTNVAAGEAFRVSSDNTTKATNAAVTLNPLMVVKTDGKVGIGTTNPSAGLEVYPNARIGTSYAAGAVLTVGDTDTDYPANSGWAPTYNANLLLNGLNSSSIAFHDLGDSVGTIRYTNNRFYVGERTSWNSIGISFGGPITSPYSGTDSGITNSDPYDLSYSFGYQESGAWASPYPDLVIGYHTGLKLGGLSAYNGTRFYNDHPGRAGATEIFSVGDGDNNVRIKNDLTQVKRIFPQYSSWGGATGDGGAGIVNDNGTYKALMVIGSDQAQGYGRWVRMWDSVWVNTRVDAPIFYDSNNTGYYVDPSGTAVLNSICAGGNCGSYLTHDGTYMRTQGNHRVTGTFYNDGTAYSQIYYDANNGGYYVNPDGTSNLNTTVAGNYYTGYNSVTRIRMSGNIIWTETSNATAGYQLELQYNGSSHGGVRIAGDRPGGGSLTVNGAVTASNVSDRRLKKDIQPIGNALETLERFKGVSYRWKDPDALAKDSFEVERGTYMGFIAQDVQEIFPDWVNTRGDGTMVLKETHYTKNGMQALLVEAVRELHQKISAFMDETKSALASLTKRVDEMVNRQNKLEKMLEEQQKVIEKQQSEIEQLKQAVQNENGTDN